MFGGTLNKLLATTGDDVASGIARTANKATSKATVKAVTTVDDAQARYFTWKK